MVSRSIVIGTVIAAVSGCAAAAGTWFALRTGQCSMSPAAQEYFKPQQYDMTHGQEMKPRW